MNNPRVSIIMATFNRANLIGESLMAISVQTYTDWECLVIDDGSSDDTKMVVSKFKEKDSRFNYFFRSKNHRKGLPGCRNQGLENAKGEYIVFMDDDDIPHPQLLEISVQENNRHGTDFCRYLRTTFIGKFNKSFHPVSDHEVEFIGKDSLTDMVTGKLPFNSCQVLWKKSCFEEIRFDEELMFAEEWECYSRILLKGFKGITVNQELYFARKHSSSNTGEYQQKDKVRVKSYISAASKVLHHLEEKNQFNLQLKQFFIRLGIELNSYKLMEETIRVAKGNFYERMKYRIGFELYPLIRPMFYLKAKFLKI